MSNEQIQKIAEKYFPQIYKSSKNPHTEACFEAIKEATDAPSTTSNETPTSDGKEPLQYACDEHGWCDFKPCPKCKTPTPRTDAIKAGFSCIEDVVAPIEDFEKLERELIAAEKNLADAQADIAEEIKQGEIYQSDAAAMRETLQDFLFYIAFVLKTAPQIHYQASGDKNTRELIIKAISTTAGKELLDRLEKAETDLKEALENQAEPFHTCLGKDCINKTCQMRQERDSLKSSLAMAEEKVKQSLLERASGLLHEQKLLNNIAALQKAAMELAMAYKEEYGYVPSYYTNLPPEVRGV